MLSNKTELFWCATYVDCFSEASACDQIKALYKDVSFVLALSFHYYAFIHTCFRGNEYDNDATVVYFNSYDPSDRNREY